MPLNLEIAVEFGACPWRPVSHGTKAADRELPRPLALWNGRGCHILQGPGALHQSGRPNGLRQCDYKIRWHKTVPFLFTRTFYAKI